MNYISLSDKEIELIKLYKTNANSTLTGCFVIVPFLFISGIIFLILNISSDSVHDIFFLFFTCFLIFISSYFLYIFLVNIKNYVNPLIEDDLVHKLKIVGETIVKEKIEVENSDSENYYSIHFQDDRVASIALKYDFWKKINIGDILYIEQSKYFGFLFSVKMNGVNIKQHLARNQQYF